MDVQLLQYPGLTGRTTLSPPCAKARMALRAKGVEHRLVNLTMPSQVRKHNPRGRVPILKIDGESVVDSTDILTELDRRFPEPPLGFDDPRDHATALMLEDWADEVLYFYGLWLRWLDDDNFARLKREVLSRLPIPVRWIAPIIARREVIARARGQGVGTKDAATVRREVSTAIANVATLLDGREWLVGGRFSRADLAVAAWFDQFRFERLTPDTRRVIDGHAAIPPWLERVHAICGNPADPEVNA